VVLACACPVVAQQSVEYASVSGRVTDPSGAVVLGAQVAVRQIQTNVTGTTVTDHEGRFRFPYLRIGPYEITVSQRGFKDATRALTLTVGSAFELPITF
jgi:protocatechuate 3,4-dioxygenase beta subunit